ncbi:MAG TPA: hypothetical protein VGM78_06180, partial [Ilumatobacteraceae bacterium]
MAASSADEVTKVRSRLEQLGARFSDVATPASARRLVLAAAPDAWAAERIVATLRDEGAFAVSRPDAGPRLEGWMRHTRPLTFGDRL